MQRSSNIPDISDLCNLGTKPDNIKVSLSISNNVFLPPHFCPAPAIRFFMILFCKNPLGYWYGFGGFGGAFFECVILHGMTLI